MVVYSGSTPYVANKYAAEGCGQKSASFIAAILRLVLGESQCVEHLQSYSPNYE